jgi:hypothetical protein
MGDREPATTIMSRMLELLDLTGAPHRSPIDLRAISSLSVFLDHQFAILLWSTTKFEQADGVSAIVFSFSIGDVPQSESSKSTAAPNVVERGRTSSCRQGASANTK